MVVVVGIVWGTGGFGGGGGGGPCSYGGAGGAGGNVSAEDGSDYITVNSQTPSGHRSVSDLKLVSSDVIKYRNRLVQPETYDYRAQSS